MQIKIKRIIAILLLVCFLVSLTATAGSAKNDKGQGLKVKTSGGSPVPQSYTSFNVWVGSGGVGTAKNIENTVVDFKPEKIKQMGPTLFPS